MKELIHSIRKFKKFSIWNWFKKFTSWFARHFSWNSIKSCQKVENMQKSRKIIKIRNSSFVLKFCIFFSMFDEKWILKVCRARFELQFVRSLFFLTLKKLVQISFSRSPRNLSISSPCRKMQIRIFFSMFREKWYTKKL